MLATALAALLLAAPADVPPWVAAWPGYAALVWQYKTPPPGPEALAAYRSAGLGGIHLDNGFSDRLLDFAIEHHLPYYVDHAAGKGDLHLKQGDWDAFFAEYRRTRGLAARPNSLFDPTVRARLFDTLAANVTRAKSGPVLAYAFDDEISTTRFTSPVDLDWSPPAQAAFRAWLRGVYGDVAVLNAQWGTDFASLDEAEPLPVDALREAHGRPFSEWNLSRWADHRRFMDEAFAALLAELAAAANALDPDHPAGFVGGQAPAAYGGFDYGLLADAVQFIEAYDIGGTNEILGSLMTPARKPRVQTFFSSLDPVRDRWFLWYYFAHGNRGVIAWPETGGRSWFEGDTAIEPIRALKPTFEELQGPLAGLLTDADRAGSRVALYYSQPSIRVSWFMDIAPHGGTWVNRSSSLNNDNATDGLNRVAWLKLLEDAGFQPTFVTDRQVAAGGLRREEFDALILGRTLALSDAEADAIRAFAAAGGVVVADYLPGVFDQHGRGREVGALDALFGVTRDPSAGVLGGGIAEVNGELYQQPLPDRLAYDGALRWGGEVLYERGLRADGGRAEATVNGSAALVRNGNALYLNLTPLPYLLHRGEARGEAWRERITAELARAGVAPLGRLSVDGRPAPTVELLRWHRPRAPRDERWVYAVVANPVRRAAIDGAGTVAGALTDQPATLRLELTEPVSGLRNARTGRVLGDGRAFEDPWVPCEANVYVAGE